MKLTCIQSELNTNLSLVNRAVPSRPTHPVLGNVLLEADTENQRVSLTAFDLSLGLQTSFNANVEADGAIAIPAKLFNDIVSRLPEGDITLEDSLSEAESDADTESLSITLTSTSGQYKMRGMNSEDFPELPQIEDGMVVKLPVEALIEGLRGSLFATSADETKQVLTGVHLMVQEDSLEFAATDGHRLAVVETLNAKPTSEESQEDEENEEKPASEDTISSFELTVPARTLRELERMLGLSESSDTVALQFEVGQIIFQGGNHRLTSRTLEGQYPAYRQLIPGQFQRQVAIPRRQLLSAVERIAVLADQKNNIVKFDIDAQAQTIDLTVETQDVGSARESLSAQVTGESIEIAFNVKYLIDGLKALSTSDIQLQMNAANTPVILTPLGGLKMTYLIMPVQIRD
ncbi:DNA polymerase III subunit beta [Coleofasciculus sp. E2-BRE-01]|uniref:DNA polymerase III subunit beta n=1 Tax=Coleofasciculus sp. E2-BRE-01 TaxID=3069524 RepID=UPI0032F4A19D